MKLIAVFALPDCFFFIQKSIGGASSVILYLIVVLLGTVFSSTQIAAVFAHQDVSEFL